MPNVEFTDAQVRSVTVWKIEGRLLHHQSPHQARARTHASALAGDSAPPPHWREAARSAGGWPTSGPDRLAAMAAVTVVITSYNQGPLIHEAVESSLAPDGSSGTDHHRERWVR